MPSHPFSSSSSTSLLIEADLPDAADYFAMESFFMQQPEPPELFSIWSTPPTLMLGLNQIVQQEIDREAAERLGVAIRRRKSGGGTIYTDRGSFQITILTPHAPDPAGCLRQNARRIADALKTCGINVDFSGRNDILAGERKVSGSAGYSCNGHYLYHASLLFSTDLGRLEPLLTVDPSKLTRHGIRSVRQRVANLSEFTLLSLPEFLQKMKAALVPGNAERRALTPAELAAISRIKAQTFGNTEWNLNGPSAGTASQTWPPERDGGAR